MDLNSTESQSGNLTSSKIVLVWGQPWLWKEASGTSGPVSYKQFQVLATEEQKQFWKDWDFQF